MLAIILSIWEYSYSNYLIIIISISMVFYVIFKVKWDIDKKFKFIKICSLIVILISTIFILLSIMLKIPNIYSSIGTDWGLIKDENLTSKITFLFIFFFLIDFFNSHYFKLNYSRYSKKMELSVLFILF
jgi:hypothetical protein